MRICQGRADGAKTTFERELISPLLGEPRAQSYRARFFAHCRLKQHVRGGVCDHFFRGDPHDDRKACAGTWNAHRAGGPARARESRIPQRGDRRAREIRSWSRRTSGPREKNQDRHAVRKLRAREVSNRMCASGRRPAAGVVERGGPPKLAPLRAGGQSEARSLPWAMASPAAVSAVGCKVLTQLMRTTDRLRRMKTPLWALAAWRVDMCSAPCRSQEPLR